jgi:hypothetical protein
MIIDEALFTESDGMPMPVLHLDLHPTSCPNPFSYRANGAFPAAILGGPDLDVTELDPSSLTLDGLAPLRWSIEDVASPYEGEPCGCTTAGPDGYPDLTLKFDGQLLAAVVGQHPGNTEVELGIHGMFGDGTLVTGSDCVVIRGNPARNEASGEGTGLVTRAVLSAFASGRPGEAVQEIGFHLPEAAEVMIRVYDVAGREVWTPGRTAYAAGDHRVSWTAPASGVFFYRVTAGAGSVAGKHVVQR